MERATLLMYNLIRQRCRIADEAKAQLSHQLHLTALRNRG